MDYAFEKSILRTNFFLKLIGFCINSEDSNRTVLQRLRRQWRFGVHILSLNISIFGEFLWFIEGVTAGRSLLEFTYFIPCLTLCLLGIYKVYYFVISIHHVNDVIDRLRKLHSGKETEGEGDKWVSFLGTVSKILLFSEGQGVISFAVGPLIIMGTHYYKTGEVKFNLPFFIWYPFDALNVKYWPFVYIHQLWSAWVVVVSVYGPDSFFLTCCTFIHVQFTSLHYDFKHIVRDDTNGVGFRVEFTELVDRHRELIRCVELLEIIYTKSTLFNVITSSLIICVTGFNIMAFNDFTLTAPFIGFLLFGLLQIYFYCYFGDLVITSSMEVGDAVYNSSWFDSSIADRKCFLIVLARTQKPCKLSASGFADVNLTTFTKILSNSWSYFALLKQMYD